jgi:hypothetical protein
MQRPNEPATWPLTNPQTTAGKKATELHAAWVEQFARVEGVEADHAKATADLADAEAALGNAGTAKAAADAEKAYAAAKAALDGPWQARLRGPANASREAEYALRRYVTENRDELLAEPELGDAAEDAREAVLDAASQLATAFEQWRNVANLHADVVKLADDIDRRSIPGLSPTARETAESVQRMLAAEVSRPVLGNNALPAPRVLTDALP